MGCGLSSTRVGHAPEKGGDAKGAKASGGGASPGSDSTTPGTAAATASHTNYADVGLTEADIHQRIESSKQAETLRITGEDGVSYTARYAYVSQRGFYPNQPHKANQDTQVIHANFAGDPHSLFCGVFDGHGNTGDACSIFAAERLPRLFVENIAGRGAYPSLSDQEVEECYRAAHVDANDDLHVAPAIDDSLSGTTAISVLLRGDTLFVANVGDSRAVLGTVRGGSGGGRNGNGSSSSNSGNGGSGGKGQGKVVPQPLSLDQTPFRRDERERIKRAGGTVMTIDQIEGVEPVHDDWEGEAGDTVDETGDPPRVWCASLDKPGCAFTRSLGDAVGESVGVFAVPEQVCRRLTADDKYIVLASDGVFEFLTSGAVLEMIGRFSCPLEAARAVVQEAFRLWLQYEVRTDDITLIVIFLEDFRVVPDGAPPSPRSLRGSTGASPSSPAAVISLGATGGSCSSGGGSGGGGGGGSADGGGGEGGGGAVAAGITHLDMDKASVMERPARRYFSKEAKTRLIRARDEALNGGALEAAFDVEANTVPKTAAQSAMLAANVSKTFLFSHLTAPQLESVVRVMARQEVAVGEVVIRQGDQGDHFYVVDHGEYEVSVMDAGGRDNVVSTITQQGASFGELSLMYGKPRTATVVCVAPGVLWALDRKAFRGILVHRMAQDDLIKIVRKVKVLKPLSVLKLQQLCDALVEETVPDGTYITRQGDLGDKLYIVMGGEVRCLLMTDPDEPPEEVSIVGKHGYFGEKALLSCEPYKVSFAALGTARLLSLSRGALEARIGLLAAAVRRDDALRDQSSGVAKANDSMSRQLRGTAPADLRFRKWAVTLGSWGFVGVYQHFHLGRSYGTKVVSKKAARAERTIEGLAHERTILAGLSRICPFLPCVLHATQDFDCLYVMYRARPLCDLATLLEKGGPMTEASARFALACVASAVMHLHEEGVIHRRVTPACIYVTDDGYCQLADLGCAAKMDGNKAYEMIGDSQYLAPEQISAQGYGFSVDYWAMGVLLFEALHLRTPFVADPSSEISENETALYTSITEFNPSKIRFADEVSADCRAIITALLQAEPEKRLGSTGSQEAKLQPFFASIDWEKLEAGTLQPQVAPQAISDLLGDRSDPEGQFQREFFEAGGDGLGSARGGGGGGGSGSLGRGGDRGGGTASGRRRSSGENGGRKGSAAAMAAATAAAEDAALWENLVGIYTTSA